VIAEYFADIYKRPDHMQNDPNMEVPENDEMVDEIINKTVVFSLDNIRKATKLSNFIKGLVLAAFMETSSRKMSK
jgi:hypothetical protein